MTVSAVTAAPVPERLTPAGARLSYTICNVPLVKPIDVGKNATCMVRDFPAAMVVDTPEKPVCEKGYVRVTPVTLNEVVPVFVMVSAWLVLVPRGWLANVRDLWLRGGVAV